jgi:hypothetical protein
VKNIFVVKFFTFKEIISLLITTPLLLVSVLAREKRRGRLTDSLKRTFVKNP